MSNPDVCVVVPMLNESTTIQAVVSDLRREFSHVVCVDDGSSDQSAELAQTAGAVIIRHATNLGQGAALQTGFDYIVRHPSVQWVVTFDADGQHLVEDALKMVEIAKTGDFDVVLGSRFIGETVNMPRLRSYILRAAVRFTRITAGLEVTDAHNGLRVIQAKALASLRLSQPGMAYASELMNKIGSEHLRWVEVPTTVLYSDYSRAKGQRNLNAVNILFDLAMARMRAI